MQGFATVEAWKPGPMRDAKVFLVALALADEEFTATALPESITAGSTHLAGAACGSLVSLDLLAVVGRRQSEKANAKGRKVDVFRLSPGRRVAALAFMRANGATWNEPYQQPEQQELFA